MKITIAAYDRDINMDYELALDLLLIKNGVQHSVRSTTLTDAVIYDIPDNIWDDKIFQYEYLKLVLKHK